MKEKEKGEKTYLKLKFKKKYRDWSLKIIKICLLQKGKEKEVKTQKNANK